MPSGKTHDWFNTLFLFILLIILVPIAYQMGFFKNSFFKNCSYLFVGAYLVSTFLLSPDLDLHRNRSKNNWGFIRFIWFPYSKLFKHRGLSHSLIFGTLTRLFYLYIFYFIALLVYFFFFTKTVLFHELPFFFIDVTMDDFSWAYPFSLLLGLYLPAILHTILDIIVSNRKRKNNKK